MRQDPNPMITDKNVSKINTIEPTFVRNRKIASKNIIRGNELYFTWITWMPIGSDSTVNGVVVSQSIRTIWALCKQKSITDYTDYLSCIEPIMLWTHCALQFSVKNVNMKIKKSRTKQKEHISNFESKRIPLQIILCQYFAYQVYVPSINWLCSIQISSICFYCISMTSETARYSQGK